MLDNTNSRMFKFDHILDSVTSQQDVYDECNVDDYLNKSLEGYHSTIFAYG